MPRRVDKKKLSKIEQAAEDFEGWAPASEVLTPVNSVRTIFPQLNVATRVAGWPLQRIGLIHGPSNHGKTVLALGLGLSFLRAGHFYFHVDAEMTTPRAWVSNLMGATARDRKFRALRPRTYEQTVDRVRSAAEQLVKMRDAGRIPEDASALFVIDSIQKLVPERLMEKIRKDGGLDGMEGRGAQYQAALNSQWMRELVPMLYYTNSALTLIGRESDNPDAGKFEKKYRLTGGKAIVYDSSLVSRVRREWVKRGERIVGERHVVEIHKTKVGGKDDKAIRFHFHTSNGVMIPEGFDRARDLHGLAVIAGLLKGSNVRGWVDQETGETWKTENHFVESVDSTYLDALEELCYEAIDPAKMEVEGDDGDS